MTKDTGKDRGRFYVLTTLFSIQRHRTVPCLVKQLNIITSEATTEKFSKGGLLLHRGYYCPSLISDLVNSNSTRGRLVRNGDKADFRYGFNDAGQLVSVQKNCGGIISKEFIIHNDNCEIGVSTVGFDGKTKIETVTLCLYQNGHLSEYTISLYNPYNKQLISTTSEIYNYETEHLLVDIYECTFHNKTPITQHSAYDFPVREGYISEYTMFFDQANSGFSKDFKLEARMFFPKSKRKIN